MLQTGVMFYDFQIVCYTLQSCLIFFTLHGQRLKIYPVEIGRSTLISETLLRAEEGTSYLKQEDLAQDSILNGDVFGFLL